MQIQRNSIVLLGVFTPNYDLADLNEKNLGWVVSPIPSKIIELSSSYQVLKRFMPLSNEWVRYFLLRMPPEWNNSSKIVLSNPNARAIFERITTK